MSKRVMAAMSGGVDSSVAALLLQEQGYDLCGATLGLHKFGDAQEAAQICRRLGIEHYLFDFGDMFQQQVIQRFARCYQAGCTPNPCIDCNRYIKFGQLCAKAQELGWDYLATGHYARVEQDKDSGRFLLKKALDATKDQSYVLYPLNQQQLSMILFPLGGLNKGQVRQLAQEQGLSNADKPDSQDICFVPQGDYAAFLLGELGLKANPGDFIDTQGRLLGQHRGLLHYTIGQRKGLGQSFGRPLYVVALNEEDNTVTLGDEQDLYRDSLVAGEVNFIAIPRLEQPLKVGVKVRYKQGEVPALISPWGEDKVLVNFEKPQRALTPGQAAVFYDGDTVVGGGTILADPTNF